MFKRYLSLDLPKRQSAFLWGARQTGKSTLLKEQFKQSKVFDFLRSEVFLRFSKTPHEFREMVLALTDEEKALPIILDEVQKVPILLNEVHWLIENTQCHFILCGSSARKLKRGAANLLGGRAWRFTFLPLSFIEIPNFDLLHALQNGLLPVHYLQDDATRSLRSYVSIYLKEEIQAEGVTRNLPAFARFLDAIGFSNGQQIIYSNIARDCGVNATTVKDYFQILEDTLLGYKIEPYTKKIARDIIISTPKFYLVDVGIANFLAKKTINELKGAAAGEAFEHFIFMELMAYRELNELDYSINYWRTKTGFEVDFVLDSGRIAIEVKISQSVAKDKVKGLVAFCQEHRPEHAFVVSQDPFKRIINIEEESNITIIHWREFLEILWAGKIL